MTVCVALSDSGDYELISNVLMLVPSNIVFGKTLFSTDTMLETLKQDTTDVLVIDTEIAGPDLFDCIAGIKRHKNLHVILLAPEKDFEIAYKAMKIQASELLIRPLSEAALSEAFTQAAHQTEAKLPVPSNQASRTTFAQQLSVILGMKTIPEVNESFHTTFQDGLFRVVSLAVDFPNEARIPEITSQIAHSVQSYLVENIRGRIYDIAYSIVYNEIRLVFNYPNVLDDEIQRLFPALFLHVSDTCKGLQDVELFLGVGRAYEDINQLIASSEESKRGIWTRMNQKEEHPRIVNYSETLLRDDQKRELLKRNAAIISSINTLDMEHFIRSVNALFALPEDVLSAPLAREMLLNEVRYFRDKYKTHLDNLGGASSIYHKIKLRLLTSHSFEEYKERYIQTFSELFRSITMQLKESTISGYINHAVTLINSRYMTDITLEEVARAVHLNPNYFSRMFHKEVGSTFSDYLLDLRISSAQTLLEKTDYKIADISSTVGYSDQRYFSRIFAKKVGTTPTEYRKIHKYTVE